MIRLESSGSDCTMGAGFRENSVYSTCTRTHGRNCPYAGREKNHRINTRACTRNAGFGKGNGAGENAAPIRTQYLIAFIFFHAIHPGSQLSGMRVCGQTTSGVCRTAACVGTARTRSVPGGPRGNRRPCHRQSTGRGLSHQRECSPSTLPVFFW